MTRFSAGFEFERIQKVQGHLKMTRFSAGFEFERIQKVQAKEGRKHLIFRFLSCFKKIEFLFILPTNF